MKNIIYLLTVVLLASCASSNDVVSSNHLIKRKYRKGWHNSNKGNFNKTAIASKDNEQSNKRETVEYTSSENQSPLLSSLSSPIFSKPRPLCIVSIKQTPFPALR